MAAPRLLWRTDPPVTDERSVPKRRVIAAVSVALLWGGGLLPLQAIAKGESRGIYWTWRLIGGNSGDFSSPEDVIAASNARQEALYAYQAGLNCGEAVKIIYQLQGPPPGAVGTINGQFTQLMTDGGIKTSFSNTCVVNGVLIRNASGPFVVPNNGGIGVAAVLSCPGYPWLPKTAPNGTTVINGTSYSDTREWCEASIPDSAKTCNGNPIDALSASKVAFDTDYESADGTLRVSRRYSSVAGKWWWANEVGLLDLTGRNPPTGTRYGLPAESVLVSNVKLIPAGLYYETPVPAPIDTPVPFPLLATQASPTAKEVRVTLPDRSQAVFTEATPGVFTTTAPTKPSLSVSGTGSSAQWLLRTADNEFLVFDASGQIMKEVFWDGRAIVYGYQTDTKTVTAFPGARQLTFSRSAANGPFDRIALPDGGTLAYNIDPFMMVRSFTFADGTTRTYLYNEAAYTGTTESKALWLTGLIDENNARTGIYRYDGSRAVSTEQAGGVNKFSFGYSFSSSSGYSSVTDPLNSRRQLYWENGPDGEPNLKSQSQPAGAGCNASTRFQSFDAAGNLTQQDDFKANRVCWAHDASRNLESTRVEGLSTAASCAAVTAANAALPAGSRKTSSQWHPDWRLKKAQAETGRLTTWVYHGQPDPFNGDAIAACAPADALLPDGKPIAVLCKQVEQATTDADGHLGFGAAPASGVPNRVHTWTYNRYGQMLTAKGARTDVDDTTTYSYYNDTNADHTQGDLQSVTNAAGQVTQYTKYNKHGQLLESIGPNGVVTTRSYDLRQRLLSTTEAGQTTTYTYDAAGQLTRVTWSDASYLGYEYDPAHRQTAVFDHLGNRIEYTLDNAGNRIAENVKDPGGLLSRQLSRSLDALGRVQQTTGRE